jgi:branched-chain amino acid transport system substrate-binding protein
MAALNDTIHVGVLLSQRGQMAVHERAHLQGTLLGIAAVNDAGGVLGRKLVPIIADPGSSLARSKELAERLILGERVDHLFGCSDSGIRKALMPIVERHNALLWYPTQFEGFEYSSNIIYGGACPNQHVVPLFDYLVAAGHGRFLLIGTDYVFPRETNRVARQLIAAAGGSVVGERYIPLGGVEADVARALADLPKTDAIFSTVIGPCGLIAYGMLREQGVHAPVASVGACELELSVAPDALAGHICAAPYFESISDSANSRFLRAFHKRFGDSARANWFSVNSFMQVLMFAEAAEQAGSTEVDDVARAIGVGEVEAPFGLCRVDPETNYTYCRSRIGVANGRGHFDIVYDAAEAVRPDPFLVAYA